MHCCKLGVWQNVLVTFLSLIGFKWIPISRFTLVWPCLTYFGHWLCVSHTLPMLHTLGTHLSTLLAIPCISCCSLMHQHMHTHASAHAHICTHCYTHFIHALWLWFPALTLLAWWLCLFALFWVWYALFWDVFISVWSNMYLIIFFFFCDLFLWYCTWFFSGSIVIQMAPTKHAATKKPSSKRARTDSDNLGQQKQIWNTMITIRTKQSLWKG